jgi:hypothetical protein
MSSAKGRVLLAAVALALLAGTARAGTREEVKAFREVMKEGTGDEQLRAIADLARLDDDAVGRELRKVVSTHRSDRVRAEAARALGRRGDPKDLRFLLGAIRGGLKKRPVALAGALEGIGEYGDPRSVRDLVDTTKYWMPRHRMPARAAISALGRIREGEAVEGLIALLDLTRIRKTGRGASVQAADRSQQHVGRGAVADETVASVAEYRPHLRKTLTRLTGEAFADAETWMLWWDDVGESFEFPTEPVPGKGESSEEAR